MNGNLNRKLRLGLIGGSEGSFIATIHRIAALMDNRAELVCGAFSSDPGRSKAAASIHGVDPSRAYGSYDEMCSEESGREDGADILICAAPNHVRVPACTAAWNAGFHVMTDKPLSNSLTDAVALYELVKGGGNGKQQFGVTHNYTRNPMAIQAADMVAQGELGEIHTVVAEYFQGWLLKKLEEMMGEGGQKQAEWRTDPKRAGAGCWGDIATHAFIQALVVAGVIPARLSCSLKTLVEGRNIDDHGTANIECTNGAELIVTASQVMPGHLNDLRLAVHGSKKSLVWHQESPEGLLVLENGEPKKIYDRAGGGYMTPGASSVCRTPGGHPEAYLEGFGNVYTTFYNQVVAAETGETLADDAVRAPGIECGVQGNIFIDLSQKSSADGRSWQTVEHEVFA